jgi:hypothetical protein
MNTIKDKYKRVATIEEKDGKIIERVQQMEEKVQQLILKSYPIDDAKSL